MCDLIDLSSPERKRLLSTTLASPLIPVPTDPVSSTHNTNDSCSLIIEKRESLENNPFDMMLYKTTEYIQKKDDPFEVTLEKAMRLKGKKHTLLRTCSLDLTKDHAKQKPNRENFKLNKTLDEYLLNEELEENHTNINTLPNNSTTGDSNGISMLSDVKLNNTMPTINIEDTELSILNQSVMNDTLFETDNKPSNGYAQATLQNMMVGNMEIDRTMIEQIPVSIKNLKVPKLRRCFSQGEPLFQKGSHYLKQIPPIEPLQSSDNINNMSSQISFDILNDGFIKTSSSGSSVFSSLSNISSIHGLNSVSSTTNLSLTLSNRTINRTFLESCSSEISCSSRLSENVDHNKEAELLLASKKSMSSVTSASHRGSLSDLTDKFNQLKATVCDTHIWESSTKTEPLIDKKNVTAMDKMDTCSSDNKLVDVDIFTLENEFSTESSRNSTSDLSSDSVFIEGSKINKSILQEAKFLARTFEELALKSNSESSTDDLITTNPLWMSELLPAFDDDTSVDNLIELPVSPDGNGTKSKNMRVAEDCGLCSNNKEGLSNNAQDDVQELETEFVDPISREKRLKAVTLLVDLKKLIKAEKNVEAGKLLQNLERALGINCENNAELLATYLNTPSNLEKSPQKSSNRLETNENLVQNNNEHSNNDNMNDSVESVKCSDKNSGKCVKNLECPKDLNVELKSANLKANNETEKVQIVKQENLHNKSVSSSTFNNGNNDLPNERVIIKLLTNIDKLLNEQSGGNPSLDVLKNLGNVFNFNSKNCNANTNTNRDNTYKEICQSPRKSKLKRDRKTRSSIRSNSANKLSLNLEFKKQPERVIKRTISGSQTPPPKKELAILISSSENTSKLKQITKRFPSDPGFAIPNKKVITNNYNNELQEDMQAKRTALLDLPKDKTTKINAVKNKLKRKFDVNIINKRGPMKAILPIGNMQKRETISGAADTITPPNGHKILSSTPNSRNNQLVFKKTRSSKPVASSTPDAQDATVEKIQSQLTTSPKQRNSTCDISPVITYLSVNNNGITKSPRSKLPSPKKTTPKRRPTESGIPKSQTPPVKKRLNSSFDVNQYERICDSSQRSFYKKSNSQKSSSNACKLNENIQRSPLRDNNKFIHKVKPTNLISKIRRHSVGTNVMEKENTLI